MSTLGEEIKQNQYRGNENNYIGPIIFTNPTYDPLYNSFRLDVNLDQAKLFRKKPPSFLVPSQLFAIILKMNFTLIAKNVDLPDKCEVNTFHKQHPPHKNILTLKIDFSGYIFVFH